MTNAIRLAVAAAGLAVALPTSAAASSATATLPRVAAGLVRAGDAGAAEGLAWRAWSDASPDARAAGTVAGGTFFADVAAIAAPPDSPWTAVVEGVVGEASWFAVTRTSGGGSPLPFPAMQLVAVPQPDARVEGREVRLTWAPATVDGDLLDGEDGLSGYLVVRSGSGATFAPVGEAPVAAGELVDSQVPDGIWSYALRPVYSGGVASDVRSAASAPVTVGDLPDTDRDGRPDVADNCVAFANAGQDDADGDGVGDACEFRWADLAPHGAPNGVVDVGDVVLLLQLAVGARSPSGDDMRRGDVAPARITAGTPELATPRQGGPPVLDVGDVVLALRAAVGLTAFPEPR